MRRERCPPSVPCPRSCEDENERAGVALSRTSRWSSFSVNELARGACELVDYGRPQRSSTRRRSSARLRWRHAESYLAVI